MSPEKSLQEMMELEGEFATVMDEDMEGVIDAVLAYIDEK